jgi:hypothetical protein
MIIFSIKWRHKGPEVHLVLCVREIDQRVAAARVRQRAVRHIPAQNATLFLSFPYVCPKPVLAKRSFLYPKLRKKWRFVVPVEFDPVVLDIHSPLVLHPQLSILVVACEKRISVLNVSVCLAAACLGKLIVLSRKRLPKKAFLRTEADDEARSEVVVVHVHRLRKTPLFFEFSLCFVPSLSW